MSTDLAVNVGREIPEEVAAKTDYDNAFPNDMWKKFGEAGYAASSRRHVIHLTGGQ